MGWVLRDVIHNTTGKLCRGTLSAKTAKSNLWIAPKKGKNANTGEWREA